MSGSILCFFQCMKEKGEKLNAINIIDTLTVKNYSSCLGTELDTVDSQKEEGYRTFLQRVCFQVQMNGLYSTVFLLK